MRTYYIDKTSKDFISLKESLSKITDRKARIILKEGIYFTEGTETECLTLSFDEVEIIGEGNVALYDHRGHMILAHPKENAPSTLAHTILFQGGKVTLENITVVNGCNIDFSYGDVQYPKISDTITQAYAIGMWDVEEVRIHNCRMLSVLDTLDFRGVNKSYITNSFIQGNNDFIGMGNKTYYKECDFRLLGPCPSWSAARDYLVFEKCHFTIEDQEGSELAFTKRGGNICFLECSFTGELKEIQMEIESKRESRYYFYRTTYNGKILKPKGYKENFIYLEEEETPAFRYGRVQDLTIQAFVEPVITENSFVKLETSLTIDFIEVSKGLEYKRINDEIQFINHRIGKDEEGYLLLRSGAIEAIYYFTVCGKKVKEPKVCRTLSYQIVNGKLSFDYALELPEGIKDLSTIKVYQKNELLYELDHEHLEVPLFESDINQVFECKLHAKDEESKELLVDEIKTRAITKEDILNAFEILCFKPYVLEEKNHLHMEVKEPKYLGDEVNNFVKFSIDDSRKPYIFAKGTDNAKNEEGLLYNSRGARLIYPSDKKVMDLEIEFKLAIEKQSGEGFGSANGQYLELFIDYDEKSESGIALRIEREVSDRQGVYCSIRKYENNVNELITEKVFTKAFRTSCILKMTYHKGGIKFTMKSSVSPDDMMTLIYPIQLNQINETFMLRHTGTIGIGNRLLIQELKYNRNC